MCNSLFLKQIQPTCVTWETCCTWTRCPHWSAATPRTAHRPWCTAAAAALPRCGPHQISRSRLPGCLGSGRQPAQKHTTCGGLAHGGHSACYKDGWMSFIFYHTWAPQAQPLMRNAAVIIAPEGAVTPQRQTASQESYYYRDTRNACLDFMYIDTLCVCNCFHSGFKNSAGNETF